MTLQYLLCIHVWIYLAYVFTGNIWLDWNRRTIIICTDVTTLKPPETDGGEYLIVVS